MRECRLQKRSYFRLVKHGERVTTRGYGLCVIKKTIITSGSKTGSRNDSSDGLAATVRW